MAVVASDASVPQVRTPRALDGSLPVLAADQARLPVRPSSVRPTSSTRCSPTGSSRSGQAVSPCWPPIDVTVVLRDPLDVAARLQGAGFAVERCDVRPPLAHEFAADHLAVVARRTA